MIFSIDGYYKDDKSEFTDYLVNEFDDTPEGFNDEDIFYFGLSEGEIKEAIKSGEDNGILDFVITNYRILEED